MEWELLIELRSPSTEFWQVVPGDAGEVVMLDVVPDVQIHNVEFSEVVVRLHLGDVFEVLGKDVEGSWVRAD